MAGVARSCFWFLSLGQAGAFPGAWGEGGAVGWGVRLAGSSSLRFVGVSEFLYAFGA